MQWPKCLVCTAFQQKTCNKSLSADKITSVTIPAIREVLNEFSRATDYKTRSFPTHRVEVLLKNISGM